MPTRARLSQRAVPPRREAAGTESVSHTNLDISEVATGCHDQTDGPDPLRTRAGAVSGRTAQPAPALQACVTLIAPAEAELLQAPVPQQPWPCPAS